MAVRLERDGATAVIVLDAPEKGNALSARDLLVELPSAWAEVRDDGSVHAVVVTGAGDRYFTSGADVADLADRVSNPGDEPKMRFTGRQFDVWKPIITAVNGRCYGGGLWLLADSDLAVAADHATFANPGVSIGMVIASGSVALARRASFPAVLRMAMLGRHGALSAQEALLAGFVAEVTPAPALLDTALDYAARIGRNSPAAVGQMIKVLWSGQSLDLAGALALADEAQAAWRGHPDAVEGTAAFMAHRQPRWAESPGLPH